MNTQQLYEREIIRQREERCREKDEFAANMVKWETNRPDFRKFCSSITLRQAKKLFARVYMARQEAGENPFTHAYDYDLDDRFWLAEKDFTCDGRFGANSNETVFVPAGISVKCNDHTKIIHVDNWKQNRFVPAYSNTV